MPDKFELLRYVDYCSERADAALLRRLEGAKEALELLRERTAKFASDSVFAERRERVRLAARDLHAAFSLINERKRGELALLSGKLDAMSPLSVLGRGYAIVTHEGRSVLSRSELSVGDGISVTLRDGEIEATVSSIKE